MSCIFIDLAIFLISCISVSAIAFFISSFTNRHILYSDYDQAFSVIDVVNALLEICPLNTIKKWRLLPFICVPQRCWIQKFSFPIINTCLNLYGSAAVVNCSSARAFSLIADVKQWREWNPIAFSHNLLVKSFHDKQLRRDSHIKADQIVGIQRGTNVQSYIAMYRFFEFTKDKTGWVLFWNAKKTEFMFFLIQPVTNQTGYHQCVITHILGTELCENFSYPAFLVLQRLRNVKDFVNVSSLSVIPFKYSSAAHKMSEALNRDDSSMLHNSRPENFLTAQKCEDGIIHTKFILVPFSCSPECTLKNLKGYNLAVKDNRDKTNHKTKFQKKSLKQKLHNSKKSISSRNKLRRTVSDLCFRSNNYADFNSNSEMLTKSEEDHNFSRNLRNDSKIEKTKISDVLTIGKENVINLNNRRDQIQEELEMESAISIRKEKLRSFSENALSNIEECRSLSHSDISESEENYDEPKSVFKTATENNLLAMDKNDKKEMFYSSISDFEVLESNAELSDSKIVDFMTQGNYGASELQAEVLLASHHQENVNINDSAASGSWMYHSNYKGIVVLSKTTMSRYMKVSSFLCYTEISVPPKDVWKFVKNPRFRFICDETVKSVEIIHTISDSQKLIHTYHETSSFLKKENIDFCLLQTEREELHRSYSAFHSVEFDKCPFMNSVTRAILLPSGWIVEEVEDPQKSKLTYLIQILVNSPDCLFIQELYSLVPQSVHNLKNYITSKPM